MRTAEARQLRRGDVVLVRGRAASFVTLHTAQATPGRYYQRALVQLDGREVSVRLATLARDEA